MTAQPHLPAIDPRRRVRLWDTNWRCIEEFRIENEQRPRDLIDALMAERGLTEARVTIDRDETVRWSGFFYRHDHGDLDCIDHAEIDRMLQWPTLAT